LSQKKAVSGGLHQELKKLKLPTRNKVREIVYTDEINGIGILNKLRKNSTVGELSQINRVIRTLSIDDPILPEFFPKHPQTKENYKRLEALPLDKKLRLLNDSVRINIDQLMNFFVMTLQLNKKIQSLDFSEADDAIGQIIEKHGYSHFLLRKSILIKSLVADEDVIDNVDNLIAASGLSYNNHMVSSLVHCYQEDQDFLSIKRSIMSTNNRGKWNKYTRDMLRLAFHPHAINELDLSEMIQSNLQSSIVDAVIVAKINKQNISEGKYKHLDSIFAAVNDSSLTMNCIAEAYVNSSEDLFYQQSSAWYENDDVIKYRVLNDHFYDSPESEYFTLDDDLVDRISDWINVDNIEELSSCQAMTAHHFLALRDLENSGYITRSSIFNYLIHRSGGGTYVSETELLKLMGVTCDLARTTNVDLMKALALNLDSDISRIIIYLLVAKRSSAELDGYKLRRLIQNNVIDNHEGKLTKFLSEISDKSPAVARYTYEVCNEEFLARLSHLIKSSQDITETRAELHHWMGEFTSESSYHDRARNLIIDHQINLVKDELDDNRIYVDAVRFTEWMEDEVAQELSTILLILEHSDGEKASDYPQLATILERCYYEFCSNKFFGIASYLGRRIRHGTFKGHLYSDVVSVESKSAQLLEDPVILGKWNQWKLKYEGLIDSIVREKLHIETSQKNQGFLSPYIRSTAKQEIAEACVNNILIDFKENRHVYGSIQVIVEYCWRMAEVDLRRVNSYFKGQKLSFMNAPLISEIKENASPEYEQLAKDFARDLQRRINEKLITMYGWFKRPQSVAPKASIGLLYKAVVAEVSQTFRGFKPDTSIEDGDDVEIEGGAYHVLYDAFYVIVYNAAKHGKTNGVVSRSFDVVKSDEQMAIVISITSENKEGQDDNSVRKKLMLSTAADIDNAQLNEDRSGMRKLHHLQKYDKHFNVDETMCSEGKVTVTVSYKLVHA